MSMRHRSVVIVLAAWAVLAACDSGSGGPAAASCASTITYDGQDYVGRSAHVTPSDLGPELGQAKIPACNDTGESSGREEEVVAVEIEGVSPSVAVAVTYSDRVIFMRADQSIGSAPQDVRRLLRAVDVASPGAFSTATPGVAGRWPDLRPASAASCYVQYPDDLSGTANAFDATVTAVTLGEYDDNAGMRPATVELAVHEAFAGPERQTVVMRTWDGFLPSPDPQAAVGLRVLAAAGPTLDLMGCGFTRPYDAADADAWRTVFGE